jgi:hypothetical protein
MVVIAAKGFVEMNREDAVLFKSQFTGVVRNKGGVQDPTSFKMLRIDFEPGEPQVLDVVGAKEESLTCHACGFIAKNGPGLKLHERTHVGQMIDTDAREAVRNGA